MLLLCLCNADHPLDQLTPQEVSRASAAVRRYAAAQGVPFTLRFNSKWHASAHMRSKHSSGIPALCMLHG